MDVGAEEGLRDGLGIAAFEGYVGTRVGWMVGALLGEALGIGVGTLAA